jgi:hypothetical protein
MSLRSSAACTPVNVLTALGAVTSALRLASTGDTVCLDSAISIASIHSPSVAPRFSSFTSASYAD